MNTLRVASLGLSSAGLLLQLGCAFTQQTHLALQDMSRPSREMRQDVLASTNASMVQGQYTGRQESNGLEYQGYQFTNVLAGPADRVLEVLVAKATNQVCRIGETTRWVGSGRPAFLLSCQPESAGLSDPANYFQRYYPHQDVKDYTGCSMWLSVDAPVAILLQADRTTGRPYWEFRPADERLVWVLRRRGAYILSHLKYVYAVPLDIVTSPYQLFVMLKLTHG